MDSPAKVIALRRCVPLRRPVAVTTERCSLGTELRSLVTDFRLWFSELWGKARWRERSHGITGGVEHLYREHRNWAMRVALEVLGHPQDAEDVVSEVFASIVRARAAGGGPAENVKAYLRTAIQREATRFYARRASETVTANVPERADADMTATVEIIDAIRRGLEGHPATWAFLIEAIDLNGYTVAETARALGVSEPALRSTLHRARAQTRQAIRQPYPVAS